MGLASSRDGQRESPIAPIEGSLADFTQWVPEGENKYSQSVIDLFDFIRGSAGVILNDLPLSEYKRAMYLIDLSKVGDVSCPGTVRNDFGFHLIRLYLSQSLNTPQRSLRYLLVT